MFNEETLFILGAGASWYYGYPLGKDLITSIIQNITADQIYVPLTTKQYSWIQHNPDQLNKMDFSLRDVSDQLEHINLENIPDGNRSPISISSTYLSEKMCETENFTSTTSMLVVVKMSQIKEFSELKDALKQFDPVSVDAFLNTHPSYAPAGKELFL